MKRLILLSIIIFSLSFNNINASNNINLSTLNTVKIEKEIRCKTGDLIKKYHNAEGVEKFKMGSFLLWLGRVIANASSDGDEEIIEVAKFIKNISSIEIIDLEGCSTETQAEFNQDSKKNNIQDYEILTRIKDSEDNLSILIKRKKKYVSELLIISAGSGPAIIRIKGKITQNELKKFIKNISSEAESN